MAVIAIFSGKGGVGKTSLAVNLAWAAATLSSRRTLLWDLDAQAAATFILAPALGPSDARSVIERSRAAGEAVVQTAIARLDLLPADPSLRMLDALLLQIDANKRLKRLAGDLARSYDHVILDCPPGLGTTADQLLRAADLVVVPVVPSPLATRAADELAAYVGGRRRGGPPLMTVLNMVDRRRAGHRQVLAAAPADPAIPMSGLVEQMASRRSPLGVFAPRSSVAQAVAAAWRRIEARLAEPAT